MHLTVEGLRYVGTSVLWTIPNTGMDWTSGIQINTPQPHPDLEKFSMYPF